MLLILAFAMVLTVSIVVFIFNKLTSRNLLIVTEALRLFSRKQHEVRISKSRTDEFGDLFGAFNSMADSVQELIDADDLEREIDTLDESQIIDTDISGITQTIVSERIITDEEDDKDD